MQDNRRNLLLVLFALIIFFSYQYLQGVFDKADLDKSIGIVQGYPGLVQVLKARHEGEIEGAILWSAELKSSLYGYVTVHADVPVRGGERRRYDFDVNLTGASPSVHPGNALGEEVLRILDQGGGPGGAPPEPPE